MEITLDSILAVASLFVGGGSGAFFTWRWQQSKTKAEAAKEWQNFYQQAAEDANRRMQEDREYIRELKEDRNNLREDRDKMKQQLGKLCDDFYELKRIQKRQGRQIESMRPILCGDMTCKNRQRVIMPETDDDAKTDDKNDDVK